MADHVDRYRQQVADLIPNYRADEQQDAVIALTEAERALRTAQRQLRRAGKVTG